MNDSRHCAGVVGAVKVPAALSQYTALSIDTVELIGDGELTTHAVAVLARAHADATSKGRLRAEIVDGLVDAADVTATSLRSTYPLMLSGAMWRLMANQITGAAKLIIDAQYLARAPIENVVREIRRVEAWLWTDESRTTDGFHVQRIDIAADFQGVHVAQFADTSACLKRAHRAEKYVDESQIVAYEHYDVVSGIMFGRGNSRVQVEIYDKLLQARKKGLTWVETRLRERGWDGESPVMRVEVRLRARALDDFPEMSLRDVESLAMFPEWCSKLWKYATTKMVRYCTPTSAKNASRDWPTRPDWLAVANACGADVPSAKRERSLAMEARDEAVRRACASIMSGTITLLSQTVESAVDAKELIRAAKRKSKSVTAVLLGLAARLYGERIAYEGVRGARRRVDVDVVAEVTSRIQERRRHIVAWEASLAYENMLAMQSSDHWLHKRRARAIQVQDALAEMVAA